jgi:hypothetical protein
MLTAAYIKKRIRVATYILLVGALFIPATINESKGTLILLPFALLVPTLMSSQGQAFGRIRKMAGTVLVGILLVGVFVGIYDRRWSDEGGSILSMYSEESISSRLYKAQEPGRGYDTGRIDSIVIAVRELSTDPVSLAVGLGMGNVASSFSRTLVGEYSDRYVDYGVRVTTIAYLLWETGVIGVLLAIIFLVMVFKDARAVSRLDGFCGVVALGWMGVVSVIGLSMFYKTLIEQNVLDYLFFFISGYIIAELATHVRRERAAEYRNT